MLLNHPQSTPLPPVRGKIVFHETSPWRQRLQTTDLSNTGSNQKGWSQVFPLMTVATLPFTHTHTHTQTCTHTHTHAHACTRVSPSPSLRPSPFSTTPQGSVTVNLFSLSSMYHTLFSIHASPTTFVTRKPPLRPAPEPGTSPAIESASAWPLTIFVCPLNSEVRESKEPVFQACT